MKFKQKLGVVCLLFTLVPVLLISIGALLALKDNVAHMYGDLLMQSANTQRAYVENTLQQLRAQATWMSYSDLIDKPVALKSYANQSEEMKWCGVLDEDGRVLVANDEALVGQMVLSHETLLSTINEQKGFIYREEERGSSINGMILITALPPQNSEKGTYWFTIYDKNLLLKMIKTYEIPNKGYSFLLDHKGSVIGYPDPTLDGLLQHYKRENIKKMGMQYQLEYGKLTLVTTLAATYDTLYMRRLIQQVSIVIALVIILLYMLLRQTLLRIFRPVEVLEKTILSLEKGDLTARFSYYKKDELGMITLAFNGMLDKQTMMLNAIKESEQRYRVVLEQADEVIWEWHAGSRAIYISDNWQRKCCKVLDPSHVTLDSLFEIVYPEDREKCLKQLGQLTPTHATCQFEIRIQDVDEKYLWMLIRATGLAFENHMPIKIVGVAIDIDEAKQHEKELLKLATYDHLTKVYNKKTFEEKTRNALKLAQFRNEGLAILFIDVDDFKQINDQYGHDLGDIVLASLARILSEYVGEQGIVGRFGGDEFIICMHTLKQVVQFDAWVSQLQAILDEYVFLEKYGKKIAARCSLGNAIYPRDGLQYEELVHYADSHMYRNKDKRKGESV